MLADFKFLCLLLRFAKFAAKVMPLLPISCATNAAHTNEKVFIAVALACMNFQLEILNSLPRGSRIINELLSLARSSSCLWRLMRTCRERGSVRERGRESAPAAGFHI